MQISLKVHPSTYNLHNLPKISQQTTAKYYGNKMPKCFADIYCIRL